MSVYHVCSLKKLLRYLKIGYIKPPVRAWMNIESAERFSKQTGRPIILRLKFNSPKQLEGHRGQALYISEKHNIADWLDFKNYEIKLKI